MNFKFFVEFDSLISKKKYIHSSSKEALDKCCEALKNTQITFKCSPFMVCPISGDIKTPKVRILRPDEQLIEIYLNENSQYQWLLAEAFEVFQRYIISINEQYKFVKVQKYGFPFKIFLEEIGIKYSGFATYEKTNKININLRFYLFLIRKLRNHIVHNNGIVNDLDLFIKKVLLESDIDDANEKNSADSFIKKIITNYNGNNVIVFTNNINKNIIEDLLSQLLISLSSYALLIDSFLNIGTP